MVREAVEEGWRWQEECICRSDSTGMSSDRLGVVVLTTECWITKIIYGPESTMHLKYCFAFCYLQTVFAEKY